MLHTNIISPFDNTLVEVPTIYYDITLNAPMTVPMNYWQISPLDLFEEPQISCFSVVTHKFYEIGTNILADYITVLDFGTGLLEIDQTNIEFIGLTKTLEWKLDIDDGTTDNLIQTFTIVFEALIDCSQTSLQQGWPMVELSQMFFETNPTRYPLVQPTDSLADLLGVPNTCGERVSSIVYYG